MREPPPRNEAELEDRLSKPTHADIEAMARLGGDLLVLGAGGKMGPSLVRLAQRATVAAGVEREIVAVSRFSDSRVADTLEDEGIRVIAADLLERGGLDLLPEVPNVVLMAGRKFGTASDPTVTWAANALLPGLVMRRFARSRLVVFSTGNVYPMVPVANGGSREDDPLGPVGEYAQSAMARERILGFLSEQQRTPIAIMRLNYAVELRYGVLRDLADRIWQREPIDLTMGHVNLIWQRDANSIALRLLAHCTVPPLVLNVTGAATLSVRELAGRLGSHLGVEPRFTLRESATALLSDASRCHELFGPPTVEIETVIEWVADWVREGRASFNMPTHFKERGGCF